MDIDFEENPITLEEVVSILGQPLRANGFTRLGQLHTLIFLNNLFVPILKSFKFVFT